ncbi:SRPBCC domain-containing protein [Kribbella sp. NPDC055071]
MTPDVPGDTFPKVDMQHGPPVKRAIVPVGVERAFEAFTTGMSGWWPLRSASAGEVRFEGAVGGRIIEYGDTGTPAWWGTVSDWDPPTSLSFTWHPGSDPQQAGHVTVTFTPIGGGTEVRLVHKRRAKARADYDTDWDYVLAQYAAAQ